MLKKTTTLVEEDKYQRFCDICGKEIIVSLACSRATCAYCTRDLCENCIGHEDSTFGDYRTVYCEQCWGLGDQYRPLIEEYECKIHEMYKKWQSECKVAK